VTGVQTCALPISRASRSQSSRSRRIIEAMVRRATVRQTLVTTWVALFVTTGAGAQGSALLRGVVYDSLISAAPLEGAEVWIEGTNRTACTDALGRFEL